MHRQRTPHGLALQVGGLLGLLAGLVLALGQDTLGAQTDGSVVTVVATLMLPLLAKLVGGVVAGALAGLSAAGALARRARQPASDG